MPVTTWEPRSMPLGAAPTTSELITNVRYRLTDFVNPDDTTEEIKIPDTEMDAHLLACVLEFSGYQPNIKETSLDLLAGTADYDFVADSIDDDVMEILEIEFPADSGASPQSELFPFGLPRSQEWYQTDLTLRGYDDWQDSLFAERRLVNWEGRLIDGTWRLRFRPPPSVDATVSVRYHTPHVVVDGALPTIAKQFHTLVEDMLYVRCLELLAKDLAFRPSVRDGTSAQDFLRTDTLLMRAAQMKRQIVLRLSQ